jgi:hypothetical protein
MQTVYNLGSGLIAGFAAAIISQPADTMLSKINKTKGEPGEGTTSRLIKIAKELGLRGSYSGIGARLFMVGTLTAGQFAIYGKSPTVPTTSAPALMTSRRYQEGTWCYRWCRDLQDQLNGRVRRGGGAMIPGQPRHWVFEGRLCSARKKSVFFAYGWHGLYSHFLFMCLRLICRLATCTFIPPQVAFVTVRFYEISCTIDGTLNNTTSHVANKYYSSPTLDWVLKVFNRILTVCPSYSRKKYACILLQTYRLTEVPWGYLVCSP